MCLHQDRSAGSLINAAGFHADNTVLYDIDDADAVLCAQLVQSADDVGNLHLYTVDALRNAFSKVMVTYSASSGASSGVQPKTSRCP